MRLAGTVTGPDKTGLLRGDDLFALPSHAECLPMALLEAMAAGLPVVTSPAGGIPSLIRDGENGLLIPAGSPHALAQALGRFAADPELRRRPGDAGRRLVESDYGVERAAAAWLALYQDLVEPRRRDAASAERLGPGPSAVQSQGPPPESLSAPGQPRPRSGH